MRVLRRCRLAVRTFDGAGRSKDRPIVDMVPKALVHAALARLLGLIVLCTLLGSTGSLAAQGLVDEFMQKSGLARQIGRAEGDVLAALDRILAESSDASLTPEQNGRLRNAVKTAYGADRLRLAVRAQLVAVLPEGDTEVFLKWLDTSLGKRVTELEAAGSTQDGSTSAPSGSPSVSATLSQARKADLERVLTVAGLSDWTASMVLTQKIGLARAVALLSGKPAPSMPTTLAAKDLLRPYRRRAADALAPRLLEYSARLYAPLSDDELRTYAAVLERSSPRRVIEASGVAVESALFDAAVELGRLVEGPSKTPPASRN